MRPTISFMTSLMDASISFLSSAVSRLTAPGDRRASSLDVDFSSAARLLSMYVDCREVVCQDKDHIDTWPKPSNGQREQRAQGVGGGDMR